MRQGSLLSPALFNVFLKRLISETLEDHVGTVSIGEKFITDLRFANDIDGLASSEEELKVLVEHIDMMAKSFCYKYYIISILYN